jgi:hypothetical protein
MVHASGFVPTELTWPSTWTDRLDRDPNADWHPAVAFVGSRRHRFLEVRPVSRTNGLRTVSRPSSSWPSWKSSE